jgi:sugar lactone lactonase YvrE
LVSVQCAVPLCATASVVALIVAESRGNRLTAYDIGQDGNVANRRPWADTGDDHPDGICVEAEGAVCYADVGTGTACGCARAARFLPRWN